MQAPRLLSIPTSSTYQAGELLLSWLLEARRVPAEEILEPLGLQAWLGNSVDVLHSSRYLCAPVLGQGPTLPGEGASPPQHAAEGS